MNQNNVVGILEQAQSAGLFKSQCEDLLAEIAKQGRSPQEVADFEREVQLRLFADSVQSVVSAFLAVAKLDATRDPRDAYLHLVDGRAADDAPIGGYIKRTQPLIILLNSGQGKADGRGDIVQRIWAPFGSLQMQAVALQIGEAQVAGSREATASVTVYMGLRDVPDDFVEGFSYMTFNTIGRCGFHAMISRKPRTCRRLLSELGLRSLKEAVPAMHGDSGSADMMLGFPGAFQYIVQAMPHLPGYLQNFAAQ